MQKPDLTHIPKTPGSYQFINAKKEIIYVGKAKNLRNRIASYFLKDKLKTNKTIKMLEEAEKLEFIEVASEFEALLLEYNLIQKYKPRYNVMLKDDKSYPMLTITYSDDYPRLAFYRNKYGAKNRSKNKYFGPFPSSYAVRETVDVMAKTFQIRTCNNTKFNKHQKLKKPCLLAHIGMCSAPCVEDISKDEYKEVVKNVDNFLSGKDEVIIGSVEGKMYASSKDQDYEKARFYRDKKEVLEKIVAQQIVVSSRDVSLDVISMQNDGINAVVIVLHVRFGRLTGQNIFYFDSFEDEELSSFYFYAISNIYFTENAKKIDLPKEFLFNQKLNDEILKSFANYIKDGIKVNVPSRGYKKDLLDMANNNASKELQRTKLKRRSDFNVRVEALNDLQKNIGLKRVPLHIECFDISHIQGSEMVGSMVVLKDGLPSNKDYRHFTIQHGEGNNDFLSMEEVVRRRYSNKNVELPDLIVIDGGKGQLTSAVKALTALGLQEEVDVVALAKQFEEVFRAHTPIPVLLPRDSLALVLLQTVRDEAHRFAITHHRKRRSKYLVESELDEVPGIGRIKKQVLLKKFKTLSRIKKATLDELSSIKGISETNAYTIYNFFNVEASAKKR
jgi:excinuclease ABC subunit C